jgi:putative hydrolase of the HAD superfamily
MLKGEFESANTSRVFNSVLEKLQIPYEKGFINQLIEVYRNHFPDIHLPEDSREFLVTVKGEYNLGLLTDGFLPAQEYKVQALGIERYFEEIIYTEKLGREYWKPATLGFEKLLERFEVRPRQAVYIADNEKKDFIAPNKLGMKTIKIVRENQIHKSPPPVPEGKPRYIADNFSELKQLIKTI